MPPVRLVGACLHDLMDPLAADTKALAHSLKSPALSPDSGDGGMLFAIDLGVRMGMFEQELTAVVPASYVATVRSRVK
jgi:hypothetical protein